MGGCTSSTSSVKKVRVRPSISGKFKPVTVVVVGLDNAGKTSVVNNILGDPSANDFLMPTMGFDLDHIDRRGYRVKLYGLGGSSSIRGYWNNYYDEVHAVIFVVDCADGQRMDDVVSTFEQVCSESRVAGKPILIFANKQDIPGAMTDRDLSSKLRLEELQRPMTHLVPCIAKTETQDTNDTKATPPNAAILTGFDWLLDTVNSVYEELAVRIREDMDIREAEEKIKLEEQKVRVARYKEEEKQAKADGGAAKQSVAPVSDDCASPTAATPGDASATASSPSPAVADEAECAAPPKPEPLVLHHSASVDSAYAAAMSIVDQLSPTNSIRASPAPMSAASPIHASGSRPGTAQPVMAHSSSRSDMYRLKRPRTAESLRLVDDSAIHSAAVSGPIAPVEEPQPQAAAQVRHEPLPNLLDDEKHGDGDRSDPFLERKEPQLRLVDASLQQHAAEPIEGHHSPLSSPRQISEGGSETVVPGTPRSHHSHGQ